MKANLVQDFLIQSAQKYPQKIALIVDHRRYTYEQLDHLTNQLANALRNAGIQRGDRVALFLPNLAETIISIFAVLKAGGVFVVINHSTKEDKLLYILDNSEAKCLVTWSAHCNLAEKCILNIPSLMLGLVVGECNAPVQNPNIKEWDAFIKEYSTEPVANQNIDLDLACLIYTSGSTGEPKGVMSDHSNVVFAAQSIISYLGNTEDDIILCALPLSFDYGLYQVIMSFAFSGTLVLEKGFVYPAAILEKIAEEKVTGFPGVPTIFSVLLNMDISGFDLSSLRYMTNTAAALSSWHVEQLNRLFPQATFFSMYGLTETKRTLYLPPENLKYKPESVGIPIPGTEAWIEDENGDRLGSNEIGELVIRGRHVMRGYWRDPIASSERFRQGVIPGERLCYSGDLFRMDDQGYFYFIARKDDIIKSRGEKVSPKEIENILYKFPNIREAAVIGVPDPILGQAIKAFVVLNQNGAKEQDILHHCRKHLEDFMLPKYIEICDDLPKTTTGKIKKSDLR